MRSSSASPTALQAVLRRNLENINDIECIEDSEDSWDIEDTEDIGDIEDIADFMLEHRNKLKVDIPSWLD